MVINQMIRVWITVGGVLPFLAGLVSCDASPPSFGEKPASFDGALAQVDPTGDLDGVPTFSSAEWTFQATQVQETQLEFDLSGEVVNEYFQMTNLTADASINHQQTERSVATEVFGQGTEQEARTDSFLQNEGASGLLDILVVIDNSNSMLEEQANLSTKLAPLLSYVSNSDWRIGVVTTDPRDGCLRGLISKNDSNVAAAFSNAIRAGVSGSGIERGIQQAVRSLRADCNGGNQWIRANSTIAVLVVTDEDNCSDGSLCSGADWTYDDYLIDYLNSIREVGVNARVYGLLWHPSQDQTQCPTALRQAPIYASAIGRSEGTWGSICDTDYTATLRSISQDLSVILKSQFALPYTPYESTVKVYVNGTQQNTGYQVRGNVIEFTNPPTAGSEIRVDYQFTTDPPKKVFSLYGTPAQDTLEVYLDGRKTTNFTYSTSNRQVNFEKAPMAREIKMVYRKDVNLLTDFNVEPNLNAKNIKVTVNQELADATSYEYLRDQGIIRFRTPPVDGAKIKVEYDRILGPQLAYPAFIPAEISGQVEVLDGETFEVIPFVFDKQLFIFDAADFRMNRKILVRYANPYSGEQRIDLGYDLVESTLTVIGSVTGPCESPVVLGSQLDLSACGFQSQERLTLDFAFIFQHLNEFTLDTQGIELDESFKFAVFVNGAQTNAFEISGQTVKINENLPLYAEVKVKLFRATDDF